MDSVSKAYLRQMSEIVTAISMAYKLNSLVYTSRDIKVHELQQSYDSIKHLKDILNQSNLI